jgi:hypothetical protein
MDHNCVRDLPMGLGDRSVCCPRLTVCRVDGNPLADQWRNVFRRGVRHWRRTVQVRTPAAGSSVDDEARVALHALTAAVTEQAQWSKPAQTPPPTERGQGTFQYALPTNPIWSRGVFGSHHVLTHLQSLFHAIPVRHVPVVVMGECGSGKTTLLSTFERVARMHVHKLVDRTRALPSEFSPTVKNHRLMALVSSHSSSADDEEVGSEDDSPQTSEQSHAIAVALATAPLAMTDTSNCTFRTEPENSGANTSNSSNGSEGTGSGSSSGGMFSSWFSAAAASIASVASAVSSPVSAPIATAPARDLTVTLTRPLIRLPNGVMPRSAVSTLTTSNTVPWWSWWSKIAPGDPSDTESTAALVSSTFVLPLDDRELHQESKQATPDPHVRAMHNKLIPSMATVMGLEDLIAPVHAETVIAPSRTASAAVDVNTESVAVSTVLAPDAELSALALSQLVRIPTVAITTYDLPGHAAAASSNAMFMSTGQAIMLVVVDAEEVASLAAVAAASGSVFAGGAASTSPPTSPSTPKASIEISTTKWDNIASKYDEIAANAKVSTSGSNDAFVSTGLFADPATPTAALSLERQLFKYLATIQARALTSPAPCVTFLILTHTDQLSAAELAKTFVFLQKQLLPRLQWKYPAAQIQDCWHCDATQLKSVEQHVYAPLTQFLRHSALAHHEAARVPLAIDLMVPRFLFRIRRALFECPDTLLPHSVISSSSIKLAGSMRAPPITADELPILANVPSRWCLRSELVQLLRLRYALSADRAHVLIVLLRALGDMLLVEDRQLLVWHWPWLAAVVGMVHCPWPLTHVDVDGPDAAPTTWAPVAVTTQRGSAVMSRAQLLRALMLPSPFATQAQMPKLRGFGSWRLAALTSRRGLVVRAADADALLELLIDLHVLVPTAPLASTYLAPARLPHRLPTAMPKLPSLLLGQWQETYLESGSGIGTEVSTAMSGVSECEGPTAARTATDATRAAILPSLLSLNPYAPDHVMIVGLQVEPHATELRWPPGLFAHLQALLHTLDVHLHTEDGEDAASSTVPALTGRAAILFETLRMCATSSWLQLTPAPALASVPPVRVAGSSGSGSSIGLSPDNSVVVVHLVQPAGHETRTEASPMQVFHPL